MRLTGLKFDTWITIFASDIVADESLPQIADVLTAMNGAIEEIRDHHDVALHAQLIVGGRAQALRDRGDQVRLIDREGDDLRVRRVAANQRNVGPVERRHDARRLAAVRAEDLARQEASGRVRNRVVRVNHVKTELARDLDHLVRQ